MVISHLAYKTGRHPKACDVIRKDGGRSSQGEFHPCGMLQSRNAGSDGRPVKTRSALMSLTTTISMPLPCCMPRRLLEWIPRSASPVESEKLHDWHRQDQACRFGQTGINFE